MASLRKKSNHLGIIILNGPEIRAFIQSGLLDRLENQYQKIYIFTPFAFSHDFTKISKSIKVITLGKDIEERSQIWRLRAFLYSVHSRWLEKSKGIRKWRHYINPNRHDRYSNTIFHVLEKLLFNQVLITLISNITNLITSVYGGNIHLEKMFLDHKIDAVLLSGYRSKRSVSILQTAKNLGLKTFIAINSWKDPYVGALLPIIPNKLFVWNEQHKELYLKSNGSLRRDSVKVVGSLHLAAIKSRFNSMETASVISSVDENRPIICYTAAAPNAVILEEKIVEKLVESIENNDIRKKPLLLIRMNPMESGSRFDFLVGNKNVIIQKPLWFFDTKNDWCAAKEIDLDLWGKTIAKSKLNVSISSTVTTEFALFRKPVVNVNFDVGINLDPEKSNSRFWDADFYQDCREYAQSADSYSDLVNKINLILEEKKNFNNFALEKIPWIFIPTVDIVEESIIGAL